MAGVVGLREVRYGYDGRRTTWTPPTDTRNPYFDFDPSKCIVCSRCVRACDEVQGTFALTIEGRGFDSKVVGRRGRVVHGLRVRVAAAPACRPARPPRCRRSRSIELGMPTRSVITTCAYCGVGCSFKAELQGDELVRMVPYKDGGANEGHSCVKGRFAFGLRHPPGPGARARWSATRSTTRGARSSGTRRSATRRTPDAGDPGSGTARARSAASPRRAARTKRSTSSRRWSAPRSATTTSTPARGSATRRPATGSSRPSASRPARRTSARSTQADVIMVIGANPTDGHPVFASRMKRRLREGAKLIVVDPRRIDLVRSPHIEADAPPPAAARHQRRGHQRDGPRRRHRGPRRPGVRRRALRGTFDEWAEFIARPENSPEAMEPITGVPAAELRAAARLYATGAERRRSTTASASPSTARARRWSWAWPTSRWRPATSAATASASTRCAARTTCRAPATWARSRTSCPATGTCPTTRCARSSRSCGARTMLRRAGAAHPEHVRRRDRRHLPRPVRPGRGHRAVRPEHPARHGRARARWSSSSCRTCSSTRPPSSPTCSCPGTSFLEKDGTFTNAERRINRVRAGDGAARRGKQEWEIVCEIATAMGYPMHYDHAEPDHGRDRRAHTDVRRRLVRQARRGRQRPVAVQRRGPRGHADHARGRVRARQGPLRRDRRTCRPTSAAPASSRCCSRPAGS